jgi:hypothetical protein
VRPRICRGCSSADAGDSRLHTAAPAEGPAIYINGGSVKGCTIRDSFCTGIKLCDTNLVVEGNVLTRCPLSIALNNTPQCMA